MPPINNIKNNDINDENVKLEKEEAFIRGTTRNEQAPGIQAQLDWKENQQFTLKSGKIITINIGMLLMSHLRYKFIFFAIDKTQYSLFDFLTNVFIELNGAFDHIVIDNMKTIMDSARTRNSPGIMNEKAKKFAYNGLIDLEELVALIYKIDIRANHTVCQGTNYIPAHYLELEKRNIKNALPMPNLYSNYLITIKEAQTDNSGLFTYMQNKYSVPIKYRNKKIHYKVISNKLQVYYTNFIICLHDISSFKLNIDSAHNVNAKINVRNWNNSSIRSKANIQDSTNKSNLDDLGEMYV